MEVAEVNKNINTELSDWYLNSREHLMSTSNPVFNAYRSDAMDVFNKLGIPGRKNEHYRYTDIVQSFSHSIKKSIEPEKIIFSVEDMFQCDIPDLNTEVILLVNGWYYENQPALQTLNNGMIIGSMAEAARKYPELMKKHYGKYADYKTDSMLALNTAFAQDGTFIYVPKNSGSDKAVQVVNILLSAESLFVQHRNLIIVEEGAQAVVVVCDHSLSSHKFLTNAATEVYVGNNAHLELYKLQNEHNESCQIAATHFHQESNSRVNFHTVTLHGGTIRNNVYAKLNAQGAENNTMGLFLADQEQHVDNHIFIDHAASDCTSTQKFKGILDDKGTGAFAGKILVRKDAQRTVAYQTNNNICLSNSASMNSKPILEIYADDVKCSHGATVGQLDENALFYMQSRGVSLRESKLLLMYAFGNEMLKEVQIAPLRDRLDDLIDKRLRGELSRCNSCPLNCQ